MYVWVKNDVAIVKCEYSQKELVKAIGDYKFDKSIKAWVFPLRKLVNIIDELNIQYDEETKCIYNKLILEKQATHSKLNLANAIKNNPCCQETLDHIDLSMCYEHQKRAIKLASLFDSYALFMETGTGKTLVAIKLIEYWKTPAMVVAPLSTLESVWQKEIDKFSKKKIDGSSELTSVILWNNLEELNNPYDIYLINYEQFKKLSLTDEEKINAKIGCLTIDECSKMKNHRSQITKTILKYKHSILHKLVLSGTPSPNSLLEYWGPMEFINDELL